VVCGKSLRCAANPQLFDLEANVAGGLELPDTDNDVEAPEPCGPDGVCQ